MRFLHGYSQQVLARMGGACWGYGKIQTATRDASLSQVARHQQQTTILLVLFTVNSLL